MSSYILTNHAKDRIQERKIPDSYIYQTFNSPDQSIKGKQYGTTEYIKRFDTYKVTLICKQNERYEWIIVSAWMDPPMSGTQDEKKRNRYLAYQKASGWGKFWLIVKQSFGF